MRWHAALLEPLMYEYTRNIGSVFPYPCCLMLRMVRNATDRVGLVQQRMYTSNQYWENQKAPNVEVSFVPIHAVCWVFDLSPGISWGKKCVSIHYLLPVSPKIIKFHFQLFWQLKLFFWNSFSSDKAALSTSRDGRLVRGHASFKQGFGLMDTSRH